MGTSARQGSKVTINCLQTHTTNAEEWVPPLDKGATSQLTVYKHTHTHTTTTEEWVPPLDKGATSQLTVYKHTRRQNSGSLL